MVDECTTTEEKKITFESKNESKKYINDVFNKLQKDYPNATIFLDGFFKVKSREQWQSLTKREKLSKSVNYTINLNGDSLELQDHPLDLAIAQLSNQQVVDYNLQAKIINRKECTEN